MSKFKLTPSANSTFDPPKSQEEFVAGASLVQSQAAKRPAKPIRLNLDLDPALHRRLKIRALEADTTVAALVRDLITRELQ